jgi:hypothetical protein
LSFGKYEVEGDEGSRRAVASDPELIRADAADPSNVISPTQTANSAAIAAKQTAS